MKPEVKTSKWIRAYGMTLSQMAKKLQCSPPTVMLMRDTGRLKHLEISDPTLIFNGPDKRLQNLIHNINSRCNNPSNKRYYRYGGRGIKCLLSMNDLIFLWERDGAKKMKQPSLDRKDNDGNYELKNCRFIELEENYKKGVIENGYRIMKERTDLTDEELEFMKLAKKYLEEQKS